MTTFSFSMSVGEPVELDDVAINIPASLPRPELVRQESIANGHDSCWICLSSEGELEYSCQCPCTVHSTCRAKWQLIKAGTREETHCRFCDRELVTWQDVLLESEVCLDDIDPIIKVRSAEDKSYYVEADDGEEGMERFQKTVKLLCNFDEKEQIELAFGCSIPDPYGTGSSTVNISGVPAYEVLLHLAKRKVAKGKGALEISLHAPQSRKKMGHADVPAGTYIPNTRDSFTGNSGATGQSSQAPGSEGFPKKRFSMKAVLAHIGKAVSS